MNRSGQAHQSLYITTKQQTPLQQTERGKRLKDILLCQMKYLLPQSEPDELVPAGLQEVLDVLLSARTHTHTHTHAHTHRQAAVRFWIHLRTPAATILHKNEQTKQPVFRGCAHVCAHTHTNNMPH